MGTRYLWLYFDLVTPSVFISGYTTWDNDAHRLINWIFVPRYDRLVLICIPHHTSTGWIVYYESLVKDTTGVLRVNIFWHSVSPVRKSMNTVVTS